MISLAYPSTAHGPASSSSSDSGNTTNQTCRTRRVMSGILDRVWPKSQDYCHISHLAICLRWVEGGVSMGAGSIRVAVLLIALACGVTAEPSLSAQGKIARTSGVMTIAGSPHPYLTEGRGLPCIVVGLAPGYSPLISEHMQQRIRFIMVDFKNTWGAEASRNVEGITLDVLVEEIDEARRALGLDQICVLGHSMPGL